ncbi:aminoacyl-tRNA deacylase [Lignipirellula cremea]|uniref:YbaK / prolyl-tRNA synthetases associated domain protein n=1 Tax=Lignipirellula cremea TaxID=2528010 RepID=A0A518DSM9_9BACT|nr:YbaK/EbsC family protein [Lignipirellula cremea]QDU94839.1 YbaK / prolyl-tRNA synthetases associated domain protein [Lignipirellula cremea]
MISWKEFLSEHGVPYETVDNSEEKAQTVVFNADSGYAFVLAMAPHGCQIDPEKVSQALGGSVVKAATMDEYHQLCSPCQPGAMPPFGPAYHIKTTLLDAALAKAGEIYCESDDPHAALKMDYGDFSRAVTPIVVPLTMAK